MSLQSSKFKRGWSKFSSRRKGCIGPSVPGLRGAKSPTGVQGLEKGAHKTSPSSARGGKISLHEQKDHCTTSNIFERPFTAARLNIKSRRRNIFHSKLMEIFFILTKSSGIFPMSKNSYSTVLILHYSLSPLKLRSTHSTVTYSFLSPLWNQIFE